MRALQHAFVFSLLCLLSPAMFAAEPKASDEFLQMIVKLIGDSDREFRAAGLEQVRNAAKGKTATQLFAAQLKKLDAQGQIALLSALADRGDDSAHAAVLELLASSKDETVRAAAIAAIGKLGSASDLPLLIKSLSSTANVEQTAARQSLVQLRSEGISKALAAEAKSAATNVKSALIEVLATRRATNELPMFVAASVDESSQVRGAAMAALGQLGRPDQIAAVLPGVLKAVKGAERDNAERNVAMICKKIDDEDQRAARLIDALNTVAAADRDDLLPLVGRVGGKKLISFVGDIARGPDATRRKLAIDALSKWPDASVVDELLAIVKNSDGVERDQAFQGYVKVAATRDGRNDQQRLERMKEAMKLAKTAEEETAVINRTRTAYDVEAVRFVLPYVDQPQFAQMACETIVEIAHNRQVRDPNKAEFDKVLDKVIQTSKDPVVVDRAQRYKRGETWERPKK